MSPTNGLKPASRRGQRSSFYVFRYQPVSGQAFYSTAPCLSLCQPWQGLPTSIPLTLPPEGSLNHAGAHALSPHLAFNMSLREDFPRSTPAVLQGSVQDLDQKREMVFPTPGSESEESTVELPWACAGQCGNGVPVPRQSWLLV